ncbi:MAG TPA: carboxylating nicotinate-nucleotide diphosphorylase [Longimicrobiales bacterium]|nr:carboxylating nicotinate-nucleotide diphosphorylase [Longimicrobiales bacterium]
MTDAAPDPAFDLDDLLAAALEEDLGELGDLTSQATIPEDAEARARIVARAPGCVAGLGPALRVFELLDERVATAALVTDGALVEPNAVLASVAGPTRAILAAERLALNLLGHLSGVATATRALAERVEGTSATIVDTRKTTPLWRALEKEAVRAGGGRNHRMGLYDVVLIKDNHVEAVGSTAEAVRRARTHVGPDVHVEVEIESLDELEPAIAAGADIVMLDNMPPAKMRKAVEIARGRCLLEASGGITLRNVRRVAETGVDLISVGWITHSAPALDVSLEIER